MCFLVASTPLSCFCIWLPQTLALTRRKRERREGIEGRGRWVRTYEAQGFLQHSVQSYQTCRSDWGLKLANNGQEQFLDVLWSRFAQVLLCLIMKPPCHSLWCFCWLPLPRWAAFAFNLLKQLHDSPKKRRERAEREKNTWVRTFGDQGSLQHNVQPYQTCRQNWGLKLTNTKQKQFLVVLFNRFA